MQLEIVSERLKEQRGITLNIKKVAKKLLAEKGYDPLYGARPLKRLIQTELLDKLAMQIITKKISDDSKISIGVESNQFTIESNEKIKRQPVKTV